MELALNKQDGIAWGGSYIPMSDSFTLRALRRDVHSWGGLAAVHHQIITKPNKFRHVPGPVEVVVIGHTTRKESIYYYIYT